MASRNVSPAAGATTQARRVASEERLLGSPPEVDPRALADLRARLLGGELPEIERYTLRRELGRGAMGIVYLAHDEELGREVAVKVLRPGRSVSRHRRFLREARALAALSHTSVVQVFDAGETGGRSYIVMERVRGVNLGRWLRDERRAWTVVLAAFDQAGQGLHAAHALGIVHRDFKPSNVMVTANAVKVLDFGLARSASTHHSLDRHSGELSASGHELATLTGLVVGTPAYMAPEQESGDRVGAAADQYAFCVSLWEALYGRRPGSRQSSTGLSPALGRPPQRLRRILRRGLSKLPSRRWPDMATLLAELAPRTPSRIRRGGFALGAVVVVGLGGHALMTTTDRCHEEEQRALAEVWSAPRRATLADALSESSEHPFVASVDGFMREWVAARNETCRRAPTPSWRQCYDDQLDAADRLVELYSLETAGPAVGDAVEAGSLPRPWQCTRRAPTRARDELRDEVNDANAVAQEALRRGDMGGAAQVLQTPLQRTRRRGDGLAHAILAMTLAEAKDQAGEFERAVALLTAAFHGAVAAGRDDLAVRAAVGLVVMLVDRLKATDRAAAWLRHARSAVERGGDNPLDHANLDGAAALVLKARGDLDGAIAAYRRALTRQEASLAPGSVEIVDTSVNLLFTLIAARRFDDATALLGKVDAAVASAYAGDNPRRTLPTTARMQIAFERGEFATALRHQHQKIAALEALLPADHPRIAAARWDAARVSRAMGDIAAASRLAVSASESFDRNGALDPVRRGLLHAFIGLTDAELGDVDSGTAKVIASAAAATSGGTTADRIEALLLTASAHAMTGDAAASLETLRVAQDVFAATQGPAAVHRETAVALGRMNVELGRYADAVDDFSSAARAELAGEDPRFVVDAVLGLSEVASRQGDLPRAADWARAAGAMAGRARDEPRLAAWLEFCRARGHVGVDARRAIERAARAAARLRALGPRAAWEASAAARWLQQFG